MENVFIGSNAPNIGNGAAIYTSPQAIQYSNGIDHSSQVAHSTHVSYGREVSYSSSIYSATQVAYSHHIYSAKEVQSSSYVYLSDQVQHMHHAIFCMQTSGLQFAITNREVGEARYNEIFDSITNIMTLHVPCEPAEDFGTYIQRVVASDHRHLLKQIIPELDQAVFDTFFTQVE